MIVIDASALLEVLLHTDLAEPIAERLLAHPDDIHAPYLIDLEIAQVLRRWAIHGKIGSERGAQAISDFMAYTIHRHPHRGFLSRVWSLRENISAYDAAYVALSEALGVALVTCDHRLARASEHLISVDLVR